MQGLNGTVLSKIEISDSLAVLRVKPDYEIPDFLPGQYVALGLYGSAPRPAQFGKEESPPAPDKIIKRSYSIGSSPLQKDFLEFYLAILPSGALTSRMAILKSGDNIFVASKIVGTFTLKDIPNDQNLVMIATGTGLAPFISMLRTPSTWNEGRRITIVHGVRHPRDFAYHEELEGLKKERPNLSYYQIVSRESQNWHGERGYVQKFFQEDKIKLDPLKDRVLLCGNPGMIEDLEKILLPRGYTVHSKRTPGNLHVEKYW